VSAVGTEAPPEPSARGPVEADDVGEQPEESPEAPTPPSADPVPKATWRAADRLGRAMTTVNKDCEVDDDGRPDVDSADAARTDEDLTDAESPPSARV
jgi:hypothetical protein